MSDRLQELAVFVRVAESGSFSRTGRELNLSQPSVSRIVGELEARLGAKLLLRTTRRITLTDAGTVFLDRARELLAGLEDAEDAARGVDSLRGIVRLAIPVVYGTKEIIPHLPEFLALHPLLKVELTVSDARQDLVAEGADVAIRVGALDDSAFGARKLAQLKRFVVATPGYLHRHGTPKVPADLARHTCLFGPGGLGRGKWHFRRNGATLSVEVDGRVHVNPGLGVFACLMAGLGIAQVTDAMCGAEIATGALVALLRGYQMDPVEVHAIFPAGPRPSNKVRALVDFLGDRIKARQ